MASALREKASPGPISFEGRRFAGVANTANGDVAADTVFEYRQDGDLVWASYAGGGIRHGMLIAKALETGTLDARYQHMTADGELRTGMCRTTLEQLADGRLRLHEEWQWTSGDRSHGRSVVEEIAPSC